MNQVQRAQVENDTTASPRAFFNSNGSYNQNMIAKTKLTDVDMTKLIENKVAFTNEQIGNMNEKQLSYALDALMPSFVEQTKNNKAFAEVPLLIEKAQKASDIKGMRDYVKMMQAQVTTNDETSNALITNDDSYRLRDEGDGGRMEAEPEVGIYFKDEKWHGKTQLDYQPSSNVKLVATPGKTTTIIGSFEKDMNTIIQELGIEKSKNFGAKPDGFNLLNVPDAEYEANKAVFWEKFNEIWLDAAVRRRDIILLATEPNENNLYFVDLATGEMVLTGFGKEYKYLINLGYEYDAILKQMIKKR